MLLIIKFVFTV